jgi:CRP/FNR family transcriptional regulator, cyclic AMP receptor protein
MIALTEEKEVVVEISPPALHANSCLDCRFRRPGVFCNLSVPALADFDAISTHITLPAGTILFSEGQEPKSVAILCEGRIKLTKSSRDGKTLLVKVAKAGDTVGLSAALTNSPYEVTAQAIEPLQIKLFQQRDFLLFINRHMEGTLHAARSLNGEYRSALNEACRLALSNTIAGRLAHLLLELVSESDLTEASTPEIHMPLRHEDLASMLGSSRESVTRALNSLRRQQILSIKGTKITILRRDALELIT